MIRLIFCMALGIFLIGCKTGRGPAFDPYKPAAPAESAGFAATASNQISPEMLRPSDAPFRLGPGDRLDIEILGGEFETVSTFVGPDGKIYFQLLTGLQVWGLTLPETKALLESKLSEFVRNPQVAVTLRGVESRKIWITGQVQTPGVIPLAAPMSLVEAITRAGGLNTSRLTGTTEELADLHHSFIVRSGRFLPVDFHRLLQEGDTSQNIYLEPDDFIHVPSSLSTEVYVLGAVYQPRAVGFKSQMSLVTAIATARGTIEGAHLRQVAIIRGSLAQPTFAVVDYLDIVGGRIPDVALEPRDIVYVPFSPYRHLERYFDLVLNTFVRTVASNEGGRAVDRNFRSPAVSIPIN
jgi:polysaccharide biosynthesis/export protein